MIKERQHAALILEDGTIFHGKKLGYLDENGRIGEVVFNTSMSGYQEIITDPSYRGQMVCFTYPSIGNYGINPDDFESDRPYLDGIILRDYCENPSNFRSTMSLEDFLLANKLAGITDVDTRALVTHIREKGSLRGGIFIGNFSSEPDLYKNCLDRVKKSPSMEGLNLTEIFNGDNANVFVKWYIDEQKIDASKFPRIATLDFGIKHSILKHLIDSGLYPVVYPGDVPMKQWANFSHADYAGYFLSNGPGDPAVVKNGIQNIRDILALKKPLFGICLGHQMLSIALGAKTFKLKFGHHGGNQPVKRQGDHHVIITAQNHGFSTEPSFFESDYMKKSGAVCEINPNDQTVEGFYIKNEKIISIQYHPEAGPGPNDALKVFQEFRALI